MAVAQNQQWALTRYSVSAGPDGAVLRVPSDKVMLFYVNTQTGNVAPPVATEELVPCNSKGVASRVRRHNKYVSVTIGEDKMVLDPKRFRHDQIGTFSANIRTWCAHLCRMEISCNTRCFHSCCTIRRPCSIG